MTTTITVRPTEDQAKKVLERVREMYGVDPDSKYGPELRMDFDWGNPEGWPAIVWEGGPYEWAVEASFNLVDYDRPAGEPHVWLEPNTNWALSIFVDVPSLAAGR